MNLLQSIRELDKYNKKFIISQTRLLEAYKATSEEIENMSKKMKVSSKLTKKEGLQLAHVECYHKKQGEYNALVIAPICEKFNCDSREAKQICTCVVLDIPAIVGKISNTDKAEILTAAHDQINTSNSWLECDCEECNDYGNAMLFQQEEYNRKLQEVKQEYNLTKFRYFSQLNLLAVCLLEEESEDIQRKTA